MKTNATLINFSLVPSTSNGTMKRRKVGRTIMRHTYFDQGPEVKFVQVITRSQITRCTFTKHPYLNNNSTPYNCSSSCQRIRLFLSITTRRMNRNAHTTRHFKHTLYPLQRAIFLERQNNCSNRIGGSRVKAVNVYHFLISILCTIVNTPFRVKLSTTRPGFTWRSVNRNCF